MNMVAEAELDNTGVLTEEQEEKNEEMRVLKMSNGCVNIFISGSLHHPMLCGQGTVAN